jgi:hypothetical protein
MGREPMGQTLHGLHDHVRSRLQVGSVNLGVQAEQAGYGPGRTPLHLEQRLVDALGQRRFLDQDVLQPGVLRVHLQHPGDIVVERRAQFLLSGNHVAHPLVKALVRFFDMTLEQGHGNGLLAWKILIQCSDGYSGPFGNADGRPGGIAIPLENLNSSKENPVHRGLGTPLNRRFSWLKALLASHDGGLSECELT